MSYVCVGGAHDGASVYTLAQEQECINNGGRVESSPSGCTSSNSVRTQAPAPAQPDTGATTKFGTQNTIDQLTLFPLRLMRLTFGQAPFVHDLARLNEEAAADIARISTHNEDLRRRIFAMMVEVSGVAASIISARHAEDPVGGFTLTKDFVDRAAALAKDVTPHLTSDHLKSALQKVVTLSQLFAGRSFRDIAHLLAHVPPAG